jgi:ribosomal protein L15
MSLLSRGSSVRTRSATGRLPMWRSLGKRGVRNYQPVVTNMYEGPFREFRQPLETHWHAYLDGKVSREAAIRQILIETTPAKK